MALSFLTLNDAIREMPAQVAHAIDIDVIGRSGDGFRRNAEYIVMPMHPHVGFNATPKWLGEFAEDEMALGGLALKERMYPVLGDFLANGKLLSYHLSTWRRDVPNGERVVKTGYFSAVVAIRLLAMAGARVIRTLGVDGGAKYADDFKDLRPFTGGHESFDIQFDQIKEIVIEHGFDFGRLFQ